MLICHIFLNIVLCHEHCYMYQVLANLQIGVTTSIITQAIIFTDTPWYCLWWILNRNLPGLVNCQITLCNGRFCIYIYINLYYQCHGIDIWLWTVPVGLNNDLLYVYSILISWFTIFGRPILGDWTVSINCATPFCHWLTLFSYVLGHCFLCYYTFLHSISCRHISR